jgi:hypothetical protein
LGVVIGGLITAGSSYLLDERRSNRERQREERDRSSEIKRAARMIAADFSIAHVCASTACENNRYWDSTDAPLKLKSWDDYGAILAPAVSSDTWLKMRLGIVAIRELNNFRELEASVAVGQPGPLKVSSQLKPGMETAINLISDAQEALVPVCYE